MVCDFTATAKWDQYIPKKKDGSISSPLWVKMPNLMLGKCAEALALRKAFPAVMIGLYVPEEMGQANGADRPEIKVYDKAKAAIAKQTDPVVLGTALENILGSSKYSEAEKKDLKKVIDERIKEISNAPGTISEPHAAQDLGDEPK